MNWLPLLIYWRDSNNYFLVIFFRTHSIPSLTPSPLVAEQAWICQTRSWRGKGVSSYKIFTAILYLDSMKTEALCYLSGGCRSYQVLFIRINQNRDIDKLLLSQELLKTKDDNIDISALYCSVLTCSSCWVSSNLLVSAESITYIKMSVLSK